jgi:hypothetical protein
LVVGKQGFDRLSPNGSLKPNGFQGRFKHPKTAPHLAVRFCC